nr:transposase [uncultured Mediterraneibacter sp.]
MKEKRKAWKENMSGYAPEKLVFLDESGINVNMTRFYARSKGGSRAVDAVPLWKPQNTTVLSSIQLSGETAYTTYSGGTTSERFVDYLRNILIPTLFLGIRNNLLDCYKAKAWMDLTDRKAAGEHVDSKNIKKHKNDVFRLTELIDPTAKVVAP